jgi:hypothetical protein
MTGSLTPTSFRFDQTADFGFIIAGGGLLLRQNLRRSTRVSGLDDTIGGHFDDPGFRFGLLHPRFLLMFI